MQKISFIFIFFISLLLVSCNNGKTKELENRVNVLNDSIKKLNKELDNFKYSPRKLLSDIKEAADQGDIEKIKDLYTKMHEYHSDAPELKEAENMRDNAIAERNRLNAEAEKQRVAGLSTTEKIMEEFECDAETARSIEQGSVEIGMTQEMCIRAWGRPQNINRTTNSNGVSEQWCYGGNNYLFFQNGQLVSISN